MSITPLDQHTRPAELVGSLRDRLSKFASDFAADFQLLSTREVADTVAAVEELSRTVEYVQILGAHAVDRQNIAVTGESSRTIAWSPVGATQTPVRTEFRDTPDYLRARLRIGRAEARRRLRLAAVIVPPHFLNGSTGEPRLQHLSSAMAAGVVGARAATVISETVERVRPVAVTPQARDMLGSMERALTAQAAESDTDMLAVVARHWEAALDQDGKEPTEELLKCRQGVFFKGSRHGLHRLEINATEGQLEVLNTAMSTATNPRVASNGEGADQSADSVPDGRTRAQQLLDGLVGSCRIALTTDKLPAAGGHRPQVMVTVGFEDLAGRLKGGGHAVFGGLVSPATVRRLACDAEIIPVVLGGKGEVLDVGRGRRFFGPRLRRALVARDKGCSFPNCTIPAVWCEAHHIIPWYASGPTSLDNGVLLCSHHHDLVEQGNWTIDVRQGIPWFIPPPYVDPRREPLRNRYHHIGTLE